MYPVSPVSKRNPICALSLAVCGHYYNVCDVRLCALLSGANDVTIRHTTGFPCDPVVKILVTMSHVAESVLRAICVCPTGVCLSDRCLSASRGSGRRLVSPIEYSPIEYKCKYGRREDADVRHSAGLGVHDLHENDALL